MWDQKHKEIWPMTQLVETMFQPSNNIEEKFIKTFIITLTKSDSTW